MNRGHYVNFNDLSNNVELKELNRVLNDMLGMMWEKLDVGNPYKTHIFTTSVECGIGQTVIVDYDVVFEAEPTVIAYSTDGNNVSVKSTTNKKANTSVLFADTSKQGTINVMATGRIKI